MFGLLGSCWPGHGPRIVVGTQACTQIANRPVFGLRGLVSLGERTREKEPSWGCLPGPVAGLISITQPAWNASPWAVYWPLLRKNPCKAVNIRWKEFVSLFFFSSTTAKIALDSQTVCYWWSHLWKHACNCVTRFLNIATWIGSLFITPSVSN